MSAGDLKLTILSRPDCHLCHVVVRMAEGLQQEWRVQVQEVDVDSDAALAARYGTRIPVVLLNDSEILAGVFTEGDLRRAVERTHGQR